MFPRITLLNWANAIRLWDRNGGIVRPLLRSAPPSLTALGISCVLGTPRSPSPPSSCSFDDVEPPADGDEDDDDVTALSDTHFEIDELTFASKLSYYSL